MCYLKQGTQSPLTKQWQHVTRKDRYTMTATDKTAATPETLIRLYEFTIATIEGDKTSYFTILEASHAAALQWAKEAYPAATARAYFYPNGDTLPLAAMRAVVSTLSGIGQRSKAQSNGGTIDAPFSPRQQRQLSIARYTMRAMTQHGPEAVTIPHDIADFYQAAALALLNHIAPLASVKPSDIQAAFRAAMSAVQKTFRADTRGIQQAEAGQEFPRLPGSPTMRNSTPRRKAPQAYHDAIKAIRQALPSEQARAVFDAWQEHPDATIRDLAEYANAKKTVTGKHVARIKAVANMLYPDGITMH